jgi:hypothetical protein
MESGRPAFLARVPRLLALSPDSATALGVRLLAAEPSTGALRQTASQADGFSLLEGAWRRAVYLHDLEGAQVLYRVLMAPGRDDYSVAKGAYGLAAIALGMGRWEAARTLVTQHPLPAAYRHGLTTLVQGAVLPQFSRAPADLSALLQEVDAWRLRAAASREEGTEVKVGSGYLRGLLLAASGDTSAALATASAILADTSTNDAERRQAGMTVRAFVSYRAGRYTEALARLDTAAIRRWFGDAEAAPWLAQTLQRFLRAESLRGLGRWRDAIRWYDTLEQYSACDVALLGPVLLGRSAAYEKLGAHAAAHADSARFAALWRGSEASR